MATVTQAIRGLMTTLIKGYQFFISPTLGNRCRFYPSCSHYTLEAINTHGAWCGVLLGGKRILKCHPFHPGGVDPVPQPKKECI